MMVSAKIPLAATRLRNRFEFYVTQMFVFENFSLKNIKVNRLYCTVTDMNLFAKCCVA